jgi:hypothetical protein
MNSIMLDLETMGNSSNAAIISIGAVRFSVENGIEGTFHEGVALASSMACGGVVDASTIEWWIGQSEEAIASILGRKQNSIADVLASFTEWATKGGEEYIDEIWGNGATADNTWLSNAYRRAGIPVPWSYRADRCFRTMRNMFQYVEEDEFVGVKHNALDDAKNQALHLIKILKYIEDSTQRSENKWKTQPHS